MRILLALLVLLVASARPVVAEIRVVDDTGYPVALPAPAQRIVSLAPHATELLFSIGAGPRVVATVDFSDYPPVARAIPRVGGSGGIDLERIVALQPDLIVGWASGNPRRTIERLRTLGLAVFLTEPSKLEDIVAILVRLGRLVGADESARIEAERFAARYRALASRYARRASVRVFYQVLDSLLITINGRHTISDAMKMCGGENVFAALPALAPAVSEEAVIAANPDAIIAGGTETAWRAWQARWRERTELAAVKRDALYLVSADLLHRHTLRVLDGVEQLCEAIEDARGKR